MSSRFRSRPKRALAVVCGFVLLASACGGDDDDDAGSTDTTAASPGATGDTGGPETTAGSTETTAGSTEPTAGGPVTTGGESAGSAGCPAIDDSIDADEGAGAGRFMSDLQCATDAPLAAEGEPIVIGFQNPEGDPNGSFPEFTTRRPGRGRLHQHRARRPRGRHPERRPGPADPARGLQDRRSRRTTRSAAPTSSLAKEPFARRLEHQLLRQPPRRSTRRPASRRS